MQEVWGESVKAPEAFEARGKIKNMAYIPFAKRYKEIAFPALQEVFGYKNIHSTPRLMRIVINVGVGRLVGQRTAAGTRAQDAIKDIVEGIMRISGQKPAVINSRKSIAGFKLRAGTVNGVKVTLRGQRMENFFDRLIYIALPRTRDFRGIPGASFDQKGNLTIGVRESVIFPELSDLNTQFGMEISFVANGHSPKEGRLFFEKLGVPFAKETA